MTRLNDIQRILLSAASQRDDRSLYPLPESLAGAADRIASTIKALIKKGLAEEREATDAVAVYRTDDDVRYGLFATDAGLAAIGVVEDRSEPEPAAAQPERQTKTTMIVVLLERGQGATMPELIEVTGWLPHTTRAALTGLRKKGKTIERSKRDEVTCYRIVGTA